MEGGNDIDHIDHIDTIDNSIVYTYIDNITSSAIKSEQRRRRAIVFHEEFEEFLRSVHKMDVVSADETAMLWCGFVDDYDDNDDTEDYDDSDDTESLPELTDTDTQSPQELVSTDSFTELDSRTAS